MQEIALFVVPVLVIIFASGLVSSWMKQRGDARADRVRLLEQALGNPNLDRQTIETLAYQLTGARSPRQPQGRSRFLAAILGVGWLALFTGLALWVAGEFENDSDLILAGVITGVVGFALVTYPFALRELETRRAES